MTAQTILPTGENLRIMRKACGISINDSVLLANRFAEEMGSEIVFTKRSLRRFENIGVNEKSYGKTPPTLAELHILLRVYNGAPSFLIYGIKPVLYPFKHEKRRNRAYFTTPMIELMSDITSWPQARKDQFFAFYESFMKR